MTTGTTDYVLRMLLRQLQLRRHSGHHLPTAPSPPLAYDCSLILPGRRNDHPLRHPRGPATLEYALPLKQGPSTTACSAHEEDHPIPEEQFRSAVLPLPGYISIPKKILRVSGNPAAHTSPTSHPHPPPSLAAPLCSVAAVALSKPLC